MDPINKVHVSRPGLVVVDVAAAALGALDDGLDAERARAAVKDLSLAVYDCRGNRRPGPELR